MNLRRTAGHDPWSIGNRNWCHCQWTWDQCLSRVAAIKSLYDFKRTDAVWIPLLSGLIPGPFTNLQETKPVGWTWDQKGIMSRKGSESIRVLINHWRWLRDNGYQKEAASCKLQAASLTRKNYRIIKEVESRNYENK